MPGFGVLLRAADMAHVRRSGRLRRVLAGQGFELVDTDAIIESFAAPPMTAFDRWNERGLRGDRARLPGTASRRKAGELGGIDINGDLLVSLPAGGPPERTSLVDALGRANWYDPQSRGPKFG